MDGARTANPPPWTGAICRAEQIFRTSAHRTLANFDGALIALQKPRNLIPLKKPEMQGAKFFRNEAYLTYAAVTGKLKQRRRSGFFSGISPGLGSRCL